MNDILTEVKKRLQITGDYQDDMLMSWIETCKSYLVNGGGSTEEINSSSAYGVIAQGVYDMWTNKEFSSIFRDMAINWIMSHPTPSESEIKGAELATDDDIDRLFEEQEGEEG